MSFHTFFVDEPDLIFGGQKEEKDPKLGLKHHGPYFSQDEKTYSPTQARIGIIGTSHTIFLMNNILDLIKKSISSDNSNKWLFPDYPGASAELGIRCEFITSNTWNERLLTHELENIVKIDDPNVRINEAVELYASKFENILIEGSGPDVIICTLPYAIENYCGISEHTRGAKKPKFTELEKRVAQFKQSGQSFLDTWIVDVDDDKDSNTIIDDDKKKEKSYDFRRALKGRAMNYDPPSQLIRESSLEGILNWSPTRRVQHPSTFAWNLSTGLYYKARGRPWRLAKLEEGSCYIGIAFYKNKLNPSENIETSMAQIFTHTGQGFVLRGSDVIQDEYTLDYYLKKDQAESLLADALNLYEDKVKTKPRRIVIHKTSLFNTEEQTGFKAAIGKTPYDFISIKTERDFKFLRTGKYPVLRGTAITLTQNECLLYATGYTPRIRTYPGHRIPLPLKITHIGDTEINIICKEILGLTKLNWNTTQFSTQYPITLEFARRVGQVLSELPEGWIMKNHYRYYM
ncbi:MAG: hypothetical protein NWE89_05270 [Candidatus Bathyarchaeota archaeon]|nr:hypothetical protein [Candidatus Bathyarchaeota archaeon]